jgi:hypothetical protein
MTSRGILFSAVVVALAIACGGSGGSTQAPVQQQQPPPEPTPQPSPPPKNVTFGTQGPWPAANATYRGTDGILETPIVAMTTDEAQNRWVATPNALYLLRPGDEKFTRFDETDGLHLGDVTGRAPGPIGWAKYCNDRPVADDQACHLDETTLWGGATGEGIRSLAGGDVDEVFVGYAGGRNDNLGVCPGDVTNAGWDNCDPLRHSGKIDRVKVKADGTIEVTRFDLLSNQQGAKFWHDRYMYRLAYDHFVHHGTLYSGSTHGVTLLFPDKYRAPNPGEWFDSAYSEWMGDHLHARVCRTDPPAPCPVVGEGSQRMGDWRGLAVDDNGRLWHAGKWAAGRITWDPDAKHWVARNGAAFDAAFGDPYYGPGYSGPQLSIPPIFEVAAEGHEVHMTGVAVCPDGRVWFSTSGVEDGPSHDRGDVLAVWDEAKHTLNYFTPSMIGIAEGRVRDVACLADGRLAVAGYTTGLSLYDPAKGTSTPVRASSGLIPSDAIQSLEVDRMVSPQTLHVATSGGAAAIRVLP